MCGNRQTGGMKRDTRRHPLMPLAPAGRHVYSTWDTQTPKAPEGRQVLESNVRRKQGSEVKCVGDGSPTPSVTGDSAKSVRSC